MKNSLAIVIAVIVVGVFLAPTANRNVPNSQLSEWEDMIITLQANREIIDLDSNNVHDSICMCEYCIEN